MEHKIDIEEILLEGEDNPTKTVWTDDALKAMREAIKQAVHNTLVIAAENCTINDNIDTNVGYTKAAIEEINLKNSKIKSSITSQEQSILKELLP